MRVPHPNHPGFFIIRTYALWNNNKLVLAAMVIGFLVSSHSLLPQALGRCISQVVIIGSVGVLFTATAQAPCMRSYLLLDVLL
jgi:hypothetical protein